MMESPIVWHFSYGDSVTSHAWEFIGWTRKMRRNSNTLFYCVAKAPQSRIFNLGQTELGFIPSAPAHQLPQNETLQRCTFEVPHRRRPNPFNTTKPTWDNSSYHRGISTFRCLTVSQQSVTVPSPPNSMSSTIDSTTTVQNPLLLHPPTHTYLTTGEYWCTYWVQREKLNQHSTFDERALFSCNVAAWHKLLVQVELATSIW
jgi:hypothetical protein